MTRPRSASLPQPTFLPTATLTVVGHRGTCRYAPENTLPAFDYALAAGAHMLELDVQLSADGVPVVIHDGTVDRTTNGTGRVRALALEALQQLDAGAWFVDDAEQRPFKGTRIPTLAEVFRRYPDVPLTVELKTESRAIAEGVAQVVRQTGRRGRLVVASDSADLLQRFRAMEPTVCTSLARAEVARLYALHLLGLHRSHAPPGALLQIPPSYKGISLTTPRFIRAAHACGLHVEVWTVNDPDAMARLVARGVDGIISDLPADALAC
ncbi:MAG: glycerophosphodiester phosphodiesterase [Bacteroidetes bacterium]|jgi:glycerophosphoryl diester phosphodiesterase|nr:glycerophosphodiester phosphodiesterase [Bacteroidota bacterium]